MQCLGADPLLNYRPDTLVEVRRLYNLDKPGQMDEAVDILDAWIQKQDHFTKKDFSREYLERVIIQLKGSVERAKSQLDKICTLRTMLPKFFDTPNPQEDLKELKDYVTQSLLPNMTKDHIRLFVTRMNGAGPHTSRKLFLVYAHCILVNEYIKSHDYCDGLIAVCDLRGVQISELVSAINITELRQMATISMESYDIRLKAIFFISTSRTIDLLMKIFKQILSPKLASRLHVIKTIEDIYEFVPRELLPKEYGGDELTLDELDEKSIKVFSSEENKKYYKEMRKACTDESRRSVSTFNESYLGLAGTFRTLNVD